MDCTASQFFRLAARIAYIHERGYIYAAVTLAGVHKFPRMEKTKMPTFCICGSFLCVYTSFSFDQYEYFFPLSRSLFLFVSFSYHCSIAHKKESLITRPHRLGRKVGARGL